MIEPIIICLGAFLGTVLILCITSKDLGFGGSLILCLVWGILWCLIRLEKKGDDHDQEEMPSV